MISRSSSLIIPRTLSLEARIALKSESEKEFFEELDYVLETNKNALTFEFNVANVLTYDLADNSFKVKTLRFLPPVVGMSNTELLLFGRLNLNTAYGLFVDFAHSTGNQSATITIPT